MLQTEIFRRQHQELLRIAKEMADSADVGRLSRDAAPMRTLLSSLAGQLTVHLAMEDNVMYPRLLKHKDGQIRTMATAYLDEMGGIKAVFNAYVERWPTATAIQVNPTDFITETEGFLAALSIRISKENNQLYAMVDALEG